MTKVTSPRSAVAAPGRLAAVASYGLSGHAGDLELEHVLDHLARTVDAPIAVVNLVGSDHQCYPVERGVGAPETHVPDELSFCAYVVAEGAPLEVSDARRHAVFRDNPLVVSGAVRSYLGVPLTDEDGFVLGTVSVFDRVPRDFTEHERDALEGQVRMVRALLSLRRRVAAHAWDARLLAVQTDVLEAVATGRPLPDTLATLRTGLRGLARTDDAHRSLRVRQTEQRLSQIATESAARRSTVERLARQDPLTGLANRAALGVAGAQALADGGAVLFVDLDRFKQVNDRGSHALGDRVLVQLAERLASVVRAAVAGAVVGRIGGDEFAAALPRLSATQARALADRLADVLVLEVPVNHGTVSVSASVGVAMAEPGQPFDVVLHCADEAMYAVKTGRHGSASRRAGAGTVA